jgi:hypothetical protein
MRKWEKYNQWWIWFLVFSFLLLGIEAKLSEHFSFYFTGTFAEHRKWFPRFYILSYCFVRIYLLMFIAVILLFLWQNRARKYVQHSFLFGLYVLLSIMLPENYPFSKYPMYSMWTDKAYVFLLTDSNNKLIPFNQVSAMGGADMGHVYATLTNAGICDSIAGKKMMSDLKKNRTNHSSVKEQVNLKKEVIYLENNKIQTNEIRLYTDTLE